MAEERIKVRYRIKSFLFESAIECDNRVHLLPIDITGNIKNHSYKSEDRSYIHSGSIGESLNILLIMETKYLSSLNSYPIHLFDLLKIYSLFHTGNYMSFFPHPFLTIPY